MLLYSVWSDLQCKSFQVFKSNTFCSIRWLLGDSEAVWGLDVILHVHARKIYRFMNSGNIRWVFSPLSHCWLFLLWDHRKQHCHICGTGLGVCRCHGFLNHSSRIRMHAHTHTQRELRVWHLTWWTVSQVEPFVQLFSWGISSKHEEQNFPQKVLQFNAVCLPKEQQNTHGIR